MYFRACAETGKHYVDLSAESTWLASTIIPKYDFLASRTGACIVPSCGFDSVPSFVLSQPSTAFTDQLVSDLVVYHALRHLQSVKPGAGLKSSTSFFRLRGTFSGGTLQTLVDLANMPSKERRGSEWSLISRTLLLSFAPEPPSS